MADEEDDGRQATIRMVNEDGSESEEYRNQINAIDDANRRSRYESMMDDADERGSPATINMVSGDTRGADYQRQIDAMDSSYVQPQLPPDIKSEMEEREENERRERYGRATEDHELLLRSRETETLKDASLSQEEMRHESGYNVFGSLLSKNAASRANLKDAGLSKKEALAEMRPLADSDWDYSSWGSKKPISIKEGKASIDPYVDLKTYYNPPTTSNAKGKRGLSPLMGSGLSAFTTRDDGYAGLSFDDGGRTIVPSIGGFGSAIDARGYDFSDIQGKTIRTTRSPLGMIQKGTRRESSSEILTSGMPIGQMTGWGMGVGLGSAFTFTRMPKKSGQSKVELGMVSLKNQPPAFNWLDRAGVDVADNGKFVPGTLGNLFDNVFAKNQKTPRSPRQPPSSTKEVVDTGIASVELGFAALVNEDTSKSKKKTSGKTNKKGTGVIAPRTVGAMKKATPEAYTGFTPLRILPKDATNAQKRRYNKNLKAYNLGDAEREEESTKNLKAAGYSEKDNTKFLNRPIVHFDPDWLKAQKQTPRPVQGSEQKVPANVRDFLGFTPTQKINKKMLEAAWAPHIALEKEKEEEAKAEADNLIFKFEQGLDKRAKDQATYAKDRAAEEEYAAGFKRKAETYQEKLKRDAKEAKDKLDKKILAQQESALEAKMEWRFKLVKDAEDAKTKKLEDRLEGAFWVSGYNEKQKVLNAKYVSKRNVKRLEQVTAAEKRESVYNKTATIGTKLQDKLTENQWYGKGTKPWNYNPKHGDPEDQKLPWYTKVGVSGSSWTSFKPLGSNEKQNVMFQKRGNTFREEHPLAHRAGEVAFAGLTSKYKDLTSGINDRREKLQDTRSAFYDGFKEATRRYRPQPAMRAAPEIRSMFGGGGRGGGSRGSLFGMPKRAYPTRRTRAGKYVLTAAARKSMAADNKRARKENTKRRKSGVLDFMNLFG